MFGLALVLVTVTSFCAVLFWPKAAPDPVVEQVAEVQPAKRSGPYRWGGQRDVVSIADPDIEQRRALRDRAVQPRVYSGCHDARAAGHENIPIGDPAYHPDMDGDGDGLACEPIRK